VTQTQNIPYKKIKWQYTKKDKHQEGLSRLGHKKGPWKEHSSYKNVGKVNTKRTQGGRTRPQGRLPNSQGWSKKARPEMGLVISTKKEERAKKTAVGGSGGASR